MRFWAFIFCTLVLTACGQGDSEAQINSIDGLLQPIGEDLRKSEKQPVRGTDSQWGDGKISQLTPTKSVIFRNIICNGVLQQGGAVLCQTVPGAVVEIGGIQTIADPAGKVLIGFDRDAPISEKIIVKVDGFEVDKTLLTLAPRAYTVSRIDGLPPSQVSTFSEKQIVRIHASSARKKKGFASRQKTLWFKDGFTYPLKVFTKTSPFGAQRVLNGVSKKPHYGVDIAAPVGTPIYAPADGVISLADDDLYFEGAMVLIDHGQGMISMYLHMSAIDVKPGQVVKRGDKIGEVGSKGRSTGSHLCWRLKWRNRHLDPELLTKWPQEE